MEDPGERSSSQSGGEAEDATVGAPAAPPACAQRQKKLGFLSQLPRKRELVRQFTPSWFTVTMGTGSVAITVASQPFAFTGQQEIAWAVWWLTAALFVLFSLLLLGRCLFFSSTIPHLFAHPNQSLFVGAVCMSFSTLTNGVVAFFLPRFGEGAAHAAQALFWVNLPAVLGCILLVPLSMFTVHEHGLHSMTAIWLLPVVPACVAANTAGVVGTALPEAVDGIAMAFTGVALLGMGFLLSCQITTIYYNRLSVHKLPAREVIVSSFLPVGPMAMTAWAVLNLAAAGQRHTLGYLHSLPELNGRLDDAWLAALLPVLATAAALISLFLWGFATWWLLLAVCTVSETIRHGLPFNLGWWGAIFPMGVWTGCTSQLSRALHSKAFRVIAAAATAAHVLMWLVVVALTGCRAWTGQLFHAPCLSQKPPPGGGAAMSSPASRAASLLEDKLQQPATKRGTQVQAQPQPCEAGKGASAALRNGRVRQGDALELADAGSSHAARPASGVV